MRAVFSAAEAVLVVVVLAVAVIGLALLPVTTPAYVRAVVLSADAPALTGIGTEETFEAAESVRRFVVDRDAPELAAMIDGHAAFDEAAVSHLIDVREVLIPARVLTGLLALLVLVWGGLRSRSRDGRRAVGRLLLATGALLLVCMLLVVLAGASDFYTFFAHFHSLFFEAGTWQFPEDALLIRIFPLPFWMTAGATWGGLIALCAVILMVLGRCVDSLSLRDAGHGGRV